MKLSGINPDTRLIWIRSIAIIFIILIHICDKYALNEHFSNRWYYILSIEAVFRVGLILFFLLSGFLLIKDYEKTWEFIKFYKNRLLRIIPLFLFWSFIYYIYTTNSFRVSDFFIRILKGPVFYHLWFIYTICGIYLVTPFLSNIIIKCKIGSLAYYIIFSIILYSFVPFFKYIGVDSSLYSYLVPFWLVYFLSGYLLKNYLSILKISKIYYLLLIYMVCYFGVYILSFFKEDFAPPGLALFDPRPYDSNIFMYGMSLCFFIILYKTFIFSPNNFIKFISSRSYGIYLSHAFFLDLYNKYVSIDNWLINIPLSFICIIGACIFTELLLIKLKKIF